MASVVFKNFKPETVVWTVKVMGVSHSLYEHELESMKAARGVNLDTDLTTEDLKELVQKYKGVYRKAIGEAFPTGKLLLHVFHLFNYKIIGAFCLC